MFEFEIKYGVNFILAGHHGKEVAFSLFKRVYKLLGKDGEDESTQ